MAENASHGSPGKKNRWFARRQVYLRAGQDSQYVELSPLLQIGVALGFGVVALWLIGASYGAVSNALGEGKRASLIDQLNTTEQALGKTQQELDAALEDASRLAALEAELAEAKAAVPEADTLSSDETGETPALRAELERTRKQLEELRLRLSESKSEQAAIQARFEAEALATSDESRKTTEEASSLHAQLEEAFGEIETLGKKRDEATAKLAALNEEVSAKDETTERNTALLKAATAEIERLQDANAVVETQSGERVEAYEATITNLEQQLDVVTQAKDDLQGEVTDLRARIDEVQTAHLEASQSHAARYADAKADAKASTDAAMHAQSIAAGLREADLMMTIDDLRAELASSAAGGTDDGQAAPFDDQEVVALRQRVVIAESEVERLILSGLKADAGPTPAATQPEPTGHATSDERLHSELLAARADIIKLKADVRAANQRLAEKVEADDGRVLRPDNSAKLEQQLASTRSRVQQLNKALADAKLREVAIDLALINVIPSPSPPAPR